MPCCAVGAFFWAEVNDIVRGRGITAREGEGVGVDVVVDPLLARAVAATKFTGRLGEYEVSIVI